MIAFAPLGAAGAGEVWAVIVFLIVIISWLVQSLGRMRGPQRPPPGRVAPRRPPAQPMEDEIGEFLRRAAQRRGGQVPTQPPPSQRGPRPADPTRRPARREPPQPQPVRAEVVRERLARSSAEQRVGSGVDTSDIEHRSEQLGVGVARAEAELDQHLHKVLDHEVSSLAGAVGETLMPSTTAEPLAADAAPAEPLTAVAVGIATVLGNVENIRQAIIINEILHRPVERW
jgi:hypothetical protein